MFVSGVPHVAVLNDVFCISCLVGSHEFPLCLPHPVVVSGFIIFRFVCVHCDPVNLVQYVSFGS